MQLQNEVALVHHRHEGLADQRVDADRRQQCNQRHANDDSGMRQRPVQTRPVQGHGFTHQPGILVGTLLEQPGRQHRNHGERQQQRSGQGKHDGQGHRHKQLAFQALQGEQREKHDNDDENTRSHRRHHFAHRAIDHVQLGQLFRGGVVGQMGDDVFHHHHGGVHQHADGDGQATQAHQVGRHAELAHEDESGQCRQRQHHGHHHGGPEVTQE